MMRGCDARRPRSVKAGPEGEVHLPNGDGLMVIVRVEMEECRA